MPTPLILDPELEVALPPHVNPCNTRSQTRGPLSRMPTHPIPDPELERPAISRHANNSIILDAPSQGYRNPVLSTPFASDPELNRKQSRPGNIHDSDPELKVRCLGPEVRRR